MQTNRHNIPKELASAINVDHYHADSDQPSDYSATKLISPIQETELTRRYADKIKAGDVMDNFNAWVGSVLHNAVEDAWTQSLNSIVENRFYATVLGKKISGKVDCYDIDNKMIIDWKTCRLYKLTTGDTRQWEEQANIYAYLLSDSGYEVDALRIVAILLDWKKAESKFKPNYPACQVVPIDLKLWLKAEQEQFIKQRLIWLEEAKTLSDDNLAIQIPCSHHDKWEKYKDTAIRLKGSERATRKFDTKEEARTYAEENTKYLSSEYEIVERYGLPIKCIDYCSAAFKCKQFRSETIIRTGQDPHIKTLF